MQKNIFPIIKWLAALYTIGYILFGYPTDTYFMRGLTGIMTGIFSFTVLVFLFKMIDRKVEAKS